jgi:hypothetical protein
MHRALTDGKGHGRVGKARTRRALIGGKGRGCVEPSADAWDQARILHAKAAMGATIRTRHGWELQRTQPLRSRRVLGRGQMAIGHR